MTWTHPRNAWGRYGAAVLAVVVTALLTAAVPILRDRFTFFLFWPLVLGIGWFCGVGPSILGALLATAVVVFQMVYLGPPHLDAPSAVISGALFAIIGVSGAALAGWRGRAEAALEESQERFDTIANAAPVLIWMSGPDKRLTYVNRCWLEFTGRAREQEIGDGWLDAVHPDDRTRWRETYSTAFDAGAGFEMEFRLRRHDGTYRVVLGRGVPRRDQAGRVLGYVGACTDVTEQRTAVAAAEAASRSKDAFLATVSHELRAPLSPIITWVQMLRRDQLSREQAEGALTVIERNARLQAQLIEDLLDVSRIVEGKLRLQVRPVVLADVVNHAVDTVRPAADARGIRLQVVVDTTAAPIAGDPDRLQQVVWNLLSNAVKFTPRGGRVHVVLERVHSHVEIAVSDTGVGIASAQLAHLFERFWQGDSTMTRAYAGLGLGLAIVRHLVELHGGSVTAESPGEGQGSTFTVRLPLVPVARTAAEEVRRHPVLTDAEPVQPTRLDGIRVLLVDDEPDSNEAIRVLLAHSGAEVRVAGSTELALEVLNRWRPDVLVTDIGMPGQDGYALLAQVRARREGTAWLPAIALTAYASRDDRTRLLSAGFQLHVAKPAEPGELTAAIASVAMRRG